MKDLEEYIRTRLQSNYFIGHIGMELRSIGDGSAEMELKIDKQHLQQNGFMHGGVTASLCDVATGIAAYTKAPDGKNVVTAELNISYMNPSVSSTVLARGKVIKSGNLIFFCEAEVFDLLETEEKLVAKATAIMVAVDIPIAANPKNG